MLKRITPFLLLAFVVSMFTACDRSHGLEIGPIPDDQKPAITLLAPSNSNVLSLSGQYVSFTFRLDDRERLKVFRVVGQILDQKDSLIGNEYIVKDDTISGQSVNQSLTMLVPNLSPYYKVRLTAYVIDSKGEYNSTKVWVNVVPTAPQGPPHFTTNEYKDFSIYSGVSGNPLNRFKFSLAATNPPTGSGSALDLNSDVREMTSFPGVFDRVLSSPNNALAGEKDVFVVTNSASFNYDAADWNTISQAFYSNANPTEVTPSLNVGDIVIVRLRYVVGLGYDNFAIMRVKAIENSIVDSNNRIIFDYKYTY